MRARTRSLARSLVYTSSIALQIGKSHCSYVKLVTADQLLEWKPIDVVLTAAAWS
jgi:hypothetical protein